MSLREPSRLRCNVAGQSCDQCFQTGQRRNIRIVTGSRRVTWRRDYGRSCVKTLPDQLSAEQVIAFYIRRTDKVLENREMRRVRPYGGSRLFRVFDQYQPANEGSRLVPENAFAIRRPEIMGRPDGLFGSVVKIIAERRADLALEFNCRNEFVFMQDKQVLQFCRTKETRQCEHSTVLMNLRVSKPVCPNNIGY